MAVYNNRCFGITAFLRVFSKIRSQNVHFHDLFYREQNLAATKLFLSLTRVDFAVSLSSGTLRVFPALSLRQPSYGTFFLIIFQGNCSRGCTVHMTNQIYTLGPNGEKQMLPGYENLQSECFIYT